MWSWASCVWRWRDEGERVSSVAGLLEGWTRKEEVGALEALRGVKCCCRVENAGRSVLEAAGFAVGSEDAGRLSSEGFWQEVDWLVVLL